MNSSMFTQQNSNYNSKEWNSNRQAKINELAAKKSIKIKLIFPDGKEKEFSSCLAASRYLKVGQTTVRNWLKNGSPSHGKHKDFRVEEVL